MITRLITALSRRHAPIPVGEIAELALSASLDAGLGRRGIAPLTALGVAAYRRQMHTQAIAAHLRHRALEMAEGWTPEAVQAAGFQGLPRKPRRRNTGRIA